MNWAVSAKINSFNHIHTTTERWEQTIRKALHAVQKSLNICQASKASSAQRDIAQASARECNK